MKIIVILFCILFAICIITTPYCIWQRLAEQSYYNHERLGMSLDNQKIVYTVQHRRWSWKKFRFVWIDDSYYTRLNDAAYISDYLNSTGAKTRVLITGSTYE